MPPVKSPDRSADTWERRVAASGQEYVDGVQNPRTDWKNATVAANANYKAGVQAAITQDAFAKGVNKAGTEKWQRNTIEKGPQRWQQGVSLAKNAWKDGFAPYAATIQSTTLPPRGPAGSPQNINRVTVLAKALHDKKLQLRGGA